eukprot:31520-Pelagococcus_subviridis.AAC.6
MRAWSASCFSSALNASSKRDASSAFAASSYFDFASIPGAATAPKTSPNDPGAGWGFFRCC